LLLLALEKQKLSLGNRTLEVPSEACAANEIRWDQSLGGGAARAGVARGGGGGTVVVAADQAGNADYAPATQVTQTMVVNQATPTNYSYTVGYDPVGNVANFNDSVMGTWSFNYDSLNRLMSGQNTAVTSTSTQYTGMNLCWAYDSFGNRIMQIFQSAACPAAPTPGQSPATVYYNPNNQVTFVSQSAPSVISAPNGFAYDGAGNVLQDNQNTYLYDAEGRICAVQSTPVEGFTSMTQYLYDADGTRVAKGTITNWSAGCDTTQNGFTMTASYILGPGNEQLAELSWSGGVPTPVHTNVWAGGQLTATYSYDDPINYPAGILYFPLTDWLGTRRMLADQYGNLAQTCDSLPFGDGESCPATPTEHLFTGKERDAESGNDYFGARYYASSMGRFMSPDWSAKVMPVPYAKLGDPQTLNLYAYVGNNPLSRTDPTGHYLDKCKAGDKACEKGVDEFEKQRQKDLQSKKAKVRNAAAAWGDRGQDNGVNVVFKPQADVDKDSNMALKPGEHVGGMVTPGATADHKPDIEAEFAEGFGGSDLAQTIAHEGSHVGDALNFLNSYNPATGKYNPFLNYSHFDTEAQAYSAGSLVKPYSWYPNGSFGPNGYQQRDDFINSHYVCPGCQVFDPQDYPQ
jgi:RHS repeat-associated protein